MSVPGEMIFRDFRPATFIEAVWFVGWKDTDWLAVVFRHPDGGWQARYRFRYYKDSEAWQSKDEKSTYVCEATTGDEDARVKFVGAFDMLAREVAKTNHGRRWKVPVRGVRDVLERALARQSWAHLRVEAPPPARPQ